MKKCIFTKRHGLSKLTVPDKIIAMLQTQAEFETMKHSDLAEKEHSFVRQSLKSFMKCFNDFCRENSDAILSDCSGVLRLSKFSCIHNRHSCMFVF